MKWLDRFLQRYRIRKAAPYILPGKSVLDIGCHDGSLFRELGERISRGVGIDYLNDPSWPEGGFQRIVGSFPDDVPEGEEFDVITMLAVLEHFSADRVETLPGHIAGCLKPGGLLVITMPSPVVDNILAVLKYLRLIDGMSLEEHHGLTLDSVLTAFAKYFKLKVRQTFQFGLNNLLVYQRQNDAL
jgi:2-polyprenyl-3-methyl-5-hydroxy-6-metoxy-1,4-benzoquinol methylase